MPVERENQRFLGIQIIGGQGRDSRLLGILTDAEGASRGKVDPVELEDTAPSAVRDAIIRMASGIRPGGPNDAVVSVGLVVGGIVIRERFIKQAPAFGDRWRNQKLVQDLEPQLRDLFGNDLTVVAANDANALAVHEQLFPGGTGELADRSDFAVVLLTEAGVGCGLVLADHLYTGAKGGAGEIGHLKVTDDEIQCNCGNSGCLEAVSTLAAMRKHVGSGADHEAVWEAGGRALGFGLSAVMNLMNPEALLIYGQKETTGPAQTFHIHKSNRFDSPYLNAMAKEIREHVPADAASDCLIVVRTEEDLPGPRAAASIAMRAFRERRPR